MLATGRFRRRPRLRKFERIATLDPSAPLPELPDLGSRTGLQPRGVREELGDEASRIAAEGGYRHGADSAMRRWRTSTRPGGITILRPSCGWSHLLAAVESRAREVRAAREAIERARDAEYVARIAAISEECWLDADTFGQPTTWEAARLAAGCAMRAAEIGGFALIRPPGHHALSDRAMGFCIFGNAVIAARHAQAELGVERVAIVDWDVHHGNGTEAIVRGDDSILFVSLHQWPFYPGSGGPESSDGDIVNIPLQAGIGDGRYRRRLQEDRRAGGRVVRAGAADRLGRVRRARGRPARRDARDGRRVP